MKSKFTYILLCGLFALPMAMCGQDLFHETLQSTTRQMRSVGTSFTNKKVAKFKYDALNYLQEHEEIKQIDNNKEWFKQQVFFLSCFTDLYQRLMTEESSVVREEELRKLFMKNSLQYPLFNDEEEERVLQYLKSEKDYTPFSLDTNWKKAYDAVRAQLPKDLQKRLEREGNER